MTFKTDRGGDSVLTRCQGDWGRQIHGTPRHGGRPYSDTPSPTEGDRPGPQRRAGREGRIHDRHPLRPGSWVTWVRALRWQLGHASHFAASSSSLTSTFDHLDHCLTPLLLPAALLLFASEDARKLTQPAELYFRVTWRRPGRLEAADPRLPPTRT
jgi:hypothetical protein